MFQHRMFRLECADSDPLTGTWRRKVRLKRRLIPLRPNATTFNHQGKRGICGRKKRRISPATPTSIWLNWKIRGR
jgi:GH43 family beta-xylosidase